MDRDNSGTITRNELDCEELRDVLREVIAPFSGQKGVGGPSYARTQQNTEQAIDFCLRKADFNHDTSLSFTEFKSFLVTLRSKQGASHTADLIYALFDLDGDGRVNQAEFREIYRYYLGHHPTKEEFETEWRRLDAEGHDEVTREEYIRWLQGSANPIFKQHAPALRGFSSESLSAAAKIGGPRDTRESTPSSKAQGRTLPGLERVDKMNTTTGFRPRWNQNFNTRKTSNYEMPSGQRVYFSRPQSLPELERYYDVHRGFQKNKDRMNSVPELRRYKGILSTDSGPSISPERDLPGGTMRNPISGRLVKWNDHWQEPNAVKKRPPPLTLLFQCPGRPPPFLLHGTKEEDW